MNSSYDDHQRAARLLTCACGRSYYVTDWPIDLPFVCVPCGDRIEKDAR